MKSHFPTTGGYWLKNQTKTIVESQVRVINCEGGAAVFSSKNWLHQAASSILAWTKAALHVWHVFQFAFYKCTKDSKQVTKTDGWPVRTEGLIANNEAWNESRGNKVFQQSPSQYVYLISPVLLSVKTAGRPQSTWEQKSKLESQAFSEEMKSQRSKPDVSLLPPSLCSPAHISWLPLAPRLLGLWRKWLPASDPRGKPVKHYTARIRSLLLGLQLARCRHMAARMFWKKGTARQRTQSPDTGLYWHFPVFIIPYARAMASFFIILLFKFFFSKPNQTLDWGIWKVETWYRQFFPWSPLTRVTLLCSSNLLRV